MPVVTMDDQICFVRLRLSSNEILGLLERHATNYPGAAACEALGVEVVRSGFDPIHSAKFFREVILWGHGHRFLGRFLDQNSPDNLAIALREADALLILERPGKAVVRLQQLRFLGQSFASKVARFLHPTGAVILDDVIRSALGYQENQEGYDEFLQDCQTMQAVLSLSYPNLRVCDIEAAIFAKIQGY